jgi:thiamine pyrophosphokinase
MSKAIIFAGSGTPTRLPADLHAEDCFVCAADSGFDAARALGVGVDLVIGDFDSTKHIEDIQRLPYLKLERDKADSDTEAALKEALARGCDEWILVGGGEGRFDHLLSILSLFVRYSPPSAWYTRCESLYRVDTERTFDGLVPGSTVGIVPALATGRSLVTTEGLHWDVSDYLVNATQLSLSNRCEKSRVSVRTNGDPVYFSIIAI